MKKSDAMANIQARADVAIAAQAARGEQSDLFTTAQPPTAEPAEIEPAPAKGRGKGKRERLLPARHVERDFFLCDMFDYAMKDDGASMEAPIFTLATKPDLTVLHWQSKDATRAVTITPSVLGRATMFDKDVLIYVVSQMTEALNCDREDAKHRTVRFVVYDYLVSTNKPTGGAEYKRLGSTLERLRGTSIKTDIKTGGSVALTEQRPASGRLSCRMIDHPTCSASKECASRSTSSWSASAGTSPTR